MDVQQDQRISKLLPTVKCSDCGVTVEFRKLGEHLCSAPAVPELPAAYKNSNIKIGKEVPGQKIQPNLTPLLVDNNFSYNSTPSPTDSEHSNYSNYSNKFANPTINPEKSKPARSFLQKYQQVTGKPINSPSFQPPLTPSSDRGYSDMPDLQDRQVNNPNGNGVYYKDAGNMMQKNQVYGNGYQNDRERQHVRPYDQGYGKPPFENTKHPYRNVDPYRANQMPPSNNYLNDNMERAQGKYYRNPNDGYTNGDYMRREEPRSRSRSPAPGYDRQNYPQMPPNHPYGAPQPLRQAPYDRYDGQLPYGHDNYRPQNPRMPPPQEKSSDPSFPVRTQSPPSSYVSDNNNGSHKSNTTSFSSTGSSASGKYN
ncbi:16888_t:CDS:2, partial [Acaulospora morrowiae]